MSRHVKRNKKSRAGLLELKYELEWKLNCASRANQEETTQTKIMSFLEDVLYRYAYYHDNPIDFLDTRGVQDIVIKTVYQLYGCTSKPDALIQNANCYYPDGKNSHYTQPPLAIIETKAITVDPTDPNKGWNKSVSGGKTQLQTYTQYLRGGSHYRTKIS